MAIAMTMREYLKACDADYSEVLHPREVSSSRIAQQAHVHGNQLAKGVLIKGDTGYRVLVVPSTCRVDLSGVSHHFHERLGLATEDEVRKLFGDCDPGAVPTLGQAYGVRVCYDDALSDQQDIYLEAGDHETLVHVNAREFGRLMADAEHGHYSRHR